MPGTPPDVPWWELGSKSESDFVYEMLLMSITQQTMEYLGEFKKILHKTQVAMDDEDNDDEPDSDAMSIPI